MLRRSWLPIQRFVSRASKFVLFTKLCGEVQAVQRSAPGAFSFTGLQLEIDIRRRLGEKDVQIEEMLCTLQAIVRVDLNLNA